MGAPNEIQVGRYNRFVQKLLSIKGTATTFLASPELQFMLALFHGAENRYLEAWDLFGTNNAIVAPGVGNLAVMEIRNPVGSNVMAVVTRFDWVEDAATNLAGASASMQQNRGPITTDQTGTSFTGRGWDARGRPSSTCIVSFNSAAQTIPGGGQGIAVVTQPVHTKGEFMRFGEEIPLLPGEILLGIAGNTNTFAAPTIWWRERYLEDSERA